MKWHCLCVTTIHGGAPRASLDRVFVKHQAVFATLDWKSATIDSTEIRTENCAMTDLARRDFLLAAGAVVVAGSVHGNLKAQTFDPKADRLATTPATDTIPPHRSLPVQGVHLYTDKPSYAAGDSLTAFVSSTIPCEIEVVRLGDDPDSPAQDDVLHTVKLEQPGMQEVRPGSYIHVEPGLPTRPIAALSLECWLRIWNIHEPQGVITQLDNASGFGVLVFPNGTLGFFTGECSDPVATPHRTEAKLALPGSPTFNPYVTPPSTWHHVTAVLRDSRKEIWLDGRRVGLWDWKQSAAPAACPLRIGAFGREGVATGMLDADIAMPAIYSRALTEVEIRTRHAEHALTLPTADIHLLGCWPLTEERGDEVADISRTSRNGRIINQATWMIGGPSFLPAMARYKRDYEPAKDATRGHGLRLASDDLYDCRWEPTFTFVLPISARSGLYAVRGRFWNEGGEQMTHAVFVVRRAANAEPPPIALLFATNTWKAYSGAPFCPAWPRVLANVGIKGYQPKPADPLAAYCFYRFHRAGQPTYKMGWRMPWPAASPYALYSPPEIGYSHLSRADRFTQQWLENNGYRYAALSDHDLHGDEHVLDGAKVLFIVGHSEYWTREAMLRVREFLDRGGKVVCLSGNTMYWRVTQSNDGSVIECRKADAWGAQLADYMRGECWHEHDQKRGGVPRDCGDPEWRTLGVEFAGNGPISATANGAFHAIDVVHPFFHTPHESGLKAGDRFGFDPSLPGRHPLGHESDVRVSTLMDYTRRLPVLAGASMDFVDPPGIQLLAVGRYHGDGLLGTVRDYAHRVLPANLRRADDSLCDVIHWRRPAGGEVFAAPSIAAGGALSSCRHWSDILKIVLHHFGVST